MDPTQEKHERAVADAFVHWYNRHHGTAYAYHARGADPPDFVYRMGTREMLLEVTAAYYDPANATMLWQNARGLPGAPQVWKSKNPDGKLVERIHLALKNKCAKQYPSRCLLLVGLYPDLTTADEFADLIPEIEVPSPCPFAEIYLGGVFPTSSSGSHGGYRCWKLA